MEDATQEQLTKTHETLAQAAQSAYGGRAAAADDHSAEARVQAKADVNFRQWMNEHRGWELEGHSYLEQTGRFFYTQADGTPVVAVGDVKAWNPGLGRAGGTPVASIVDRVRALTPRPATAPATASSRDVHGLLELVDGDGRVVYYRWEQDDPGDVDDYVYGTFEEALVCIDGDLPHLGSAKLFLVQIMRILQPPNYSTEAEDVKYIEPQLREYTLHDTAKAIYSDQLELTERLTKGDMKAIFDQAKERGEDFYDLGLGDHGDDPMIADDEVDKGMAALINDDDVHLQEALVPLEAMNLEGPRILQAVQELLDPETGWGIEESTIRFEEADGVAYDLKALIDLLSGAEQMTSEDNPLGSHHSNEALASRGEGADKAIEQLGPWDRLLWEELSQKRLGTSDGYAALSLYEMAQEWRIEQMIEEIRQFIVARRRNLDVVTSFHRTYVERKVIEHGEARHGDYERALESMERRGDLTPAMQARLKRAGAELRALRAAQDVAEGMTEEQRAAVTRAKEEAVKKEVKLTEELLKEWEQLREADHERNAEKLRRDQLARHQRRMAAYATVRGREEEARGRASLEERRRLHALDTPYVGAAGNVAVVGLQRVARMLDDGGATSSGAPCELRPNAIERRSPKDLKVTLMCGCMEHLGVELVERICANRLNDATGESVLQRVESLHVELVRDDIAAPPDLKTLQKSLKGSVVWRGVVHSAVCTRSVRAVQGPAEGSEERQVLDDCLGAALTMRDVRAVEASSHALEKGVSIRASADEWCLFVRMQRTDDKGVPIGPPVEWPSRGSRAQLPYVFPLAACMSELVVPDVMYGSRVWERCLRHWTFVRSAYDKLVADAACPRKRKESEPPGVQLLESQERAAKLARAIDAQTVARETAKAGRPVQAMVSLGPEGTPLARIASAGASPRPGVEVPAHHLTLVDIGKVALSEEGAQAALRLLVTGHEPPWRRKLGAVQAFATRLTRRLGPNPTWTDTAFDSAFGWLAATSRRTLSPHATLAARIGAAGLAWLCSPEAAPYLPHVLPEGSERKQALDSLKGHVVPEALLATISERAPPWEPQRVRVLANSLGTYATWVHESTPSAVVEHGDLLDRPGPLSRLLGDLLFVAANLPEELGMSEEDSLGPIADSGTGF